MNALVRILTALLFTASLVLTATTALANTAAVMDNASGTSIIEVAALGAAPIAGVVISQRVTVHAISPSS